MSKAKVGASKSLHIKRADSSGKGKNSKGKSNKGATERRTVPEKKAANRSHKPRSSLGNMFRHHQDVAVDSLFRLLAEPASTFLAWAVIGIALALPLCLSLLVQNLQSSGANLDQATQISLYIEEGTAPESLQEEIAARTDVRQVELITRDVALEEFQASSGFGEVLDGLSENPLPDVLVVTPLESEAAAMEVLVGNLAALPGVKSAELDLQWVQRLNAILVVVQRLAWGLSVLLCIGVVLVIGNTIRLAIENRRAEIVVVKLVGGTNAYVARPFLYTGLWYGAGGGLLAVLVLVGGLFMLQAPVRQLTGLYGSDFRLQGLNISGVLLVLLGGGLLGWLGAWVAVLRHLRAIEPR